MDKIPMKYRLSEITNPSTNTTVRFPMITGRTTMSLRNLVEYAKNAMYVRGQVRDLEGQLNGFIEAMQDRAKAGYSINVKDWFIINGRLRGKVDETGRLTDANSYHVAITSMKDLQVDLDNFSWQLVSDTGLNCKVETLSSPGGKKLEFIKGSAIVANGKNLVYDATWGDAVKTRYQVGESDPVELALTPSEQSETYLRFNWPTALASVPANTKFTFVFNLHGKQGGTLKTSTLQAVLMPEPEENDISGSFE